MKPQDLARAIVDLGARLFEGRAGLKEKERRQLHAHWSPVSRSWQYHVHSEREGAISPRE